MKNKEYNFLKYILFFTSLKYAKLLKSVKKVFRHKSYPMQKLY